MPSLSDDQYVVWRTNGGLYVTSAGCTGKRCALRHSRYGVRVAGPEPSAHFEVIYTQYGKRHRQIDPEDVRPGMLVHIDSLRNGWVQTSMIHDTFAGDRVDDIIPGHDYLVYDRDRASIVPGGDTAGSIPLFDQGWTGAFEPLWEPRPYRERTVLRLTSHENEFEPDRLLAVVPGWLPLIGQLTAQLREDGVSVTDTWCDGRGSLVARLAGLRSDDRGQWDRVHEAVAEAECVAERTCTACGGEGALRKVAGLRGEPFGMVLCEPCLLGKQEYDLGRFPDLAPGNLGSWAEQSDLMVDPGWWPILTDLHEQVSSFVQLDRILAQQRGGRPILRVVLPDDADCETWARADVLAREAEQRASQTCEHCSAPGTLMLAPWLHICCGACVSHEGLQKEEA